MHPIVFEALVLIVLFGFVVWQVWIPIMKGEPLFPYFRFRRLYREKQAAREALHEAKLRDEASAEWRAAYGAADPTTKEQTQWPSETPTPPKGAA